MIFVAVEFHAECYLAQFAIDAHIQIAFAADSLEKFLVVAFAPFHHRRKQVARFALVGIENERNDLVVAVFHHFFARNIRVGLASARIEQTQKIVNFGGRSHGRARIFARRLLFDGDNGTQPRNLVHIGTLHIAHEMPRIGRKSLDVAALPFGINRIERQRRLATAAQASNHRQCVARNRHIDIAQIMHPRPKNLYFSLFAKVVHRIKKANRKDTKFS